MVSELGALGARLEINNFNLRELLHSGADDPEPGTVWCTWWEGGEPKIPSFLAHLLWWDIYAAIDFFIRPEGYDNTPDAYKVVDDDFETADANIERDLNRYIQRLKTLPTRQNDGFIAPYEFEVAAWNDEFLGQDYPRSVAAYMIYYFDLALHGLLTENASLSAMSLAYAYTGRIFEREIRSDLRVSDSVKHVQSMIGKRGSFARHAPTREMKQEAIRIYCERTDWPSKRQAAKTIFPIVQAYGRERFNHLLSADRGEQTVYEWLIRYEKQ